MLAETKKKPAYRMLAAVAETKGGPWFFKLTGPERTVEKNRAAFESLLASIRVGGGA